MNPNGNTCPCCGGSTVRHVRHHELYWFCLSCRQEVPILSNNRLSCITPNQLKLPTTAVAIRAE